MLLAVAKAKDKYVGGIVATQATASLTSLTASLTTTYSTQVCDSRYQLLHLYYIIDMGPSRLIAKLGSNRRYCRCSGGILQSAASFIRYRRETYITLI